MDGESLSEQQPRNRAADKARSSRQKCDVLLRQRLSPVLCLDGERRRNARQTAEHAAIGDKADLQSGRHEMKADEFA
jgi:hypothetical protein